MSAAVTERQDPSSAPAGTSSRKLTERVFRIRVMREGRLTAEFGHAEASAEKIMAAATGQLQKQAR